MARKKAVSLPVIRYWRLVNSDTWHWYEVCPIFRRSKRPIEQPVESSKRPSGELCNCCKAIERRTTR